MRIGLFANTILPQHGINDLLQKQNCEVVGVYGINSCADKPTGLRSFADQEELLLSIDFALFLDTTQNLTQSLSSAIRRGIPIFIADLTSCSLSLLQHIHALTQEIPVPIGFGNSGMDLGALAINHCVKPSALYVDMHRAIPKHASEEWVKRLIIYDLSTILRIDIGITRRVNVAGFPCSSNGLNLISLRIDFIQGSVFCYTVQKLTEENSVKIRAYGNGMDKILSISPEPFPINGEHSQIPYSTDDFIKAIAEKQSAGFGIEQAIEALSLTDRIYSKLSLFN